jgi:F-type H+-transporting ATPase subunit alpha
MIPIGRGQRELNIGDRSRGERSIARDPIIAQANINRKGLAGGCLAFRPVYSINVAIGQKNSTIAPMIRTLEGFSPLEYTIIVSSIAFDSDSNQYIAPYPGCTMGE